MEILEPPSRRTPEHSSFQNFHDLAEDILSGSAVKRAYDLELEEPRVRDLYGKHLGGHSLLLARRLTEAGVPIVQVCLATGELNASYSSIVAVFLSISGAMSRSRPIQITT
jgi:hypothetical protein